MLTSPVRVDTGPAMKLVVDWLAKGGSTNRIADEALKIARALFRGGHETSEAEATAHAFFFVARDVATSGLTGQVDPKILKDRLIDACLDHLRGKWKPTEANVQSQYRQQRLRRMSPRNQGRRA